jgi:hypothetical protein
MQWIGLGLEGFHGEYFPHCLAAAAVVAVFLFLALLECRVEGSLQSVHSHSIIFIC